MPGDESPSSTSYFRPCVRVHRAHDDVTRTESDVHLHVRVPVRVRYRNSTVMHFSICILFLIFKSSSNRGRTIIVTIVQLSFKVRVVPPFQLCADDFISRHYLTNRVRYTSSRRRVPFVSCVTACTVKRTSYILRVYNNVYPHMQSTITGGKIM
jgi:hypothetical protein